MSHADAHQGNTSSDTNGPLSTKSIGQCSINPEIVKIMEEDCAARQAWLSWVSQQAELKGCRISEANIGEQLLLILAMVSGGYIYFLDVTVFCSATAYKNSAFSPSYL